MDTEDKWLIATGGIVLVVFIICVAVFETVKVIYGKQ